jgi:hypothetical protein
MEKERIVRVSVSLPKEMHSEAIREGLSFSRVMKNALVEKLANKSDNAGEDKPHMPSPRRVNPSTEAER